MSLVRRRCLWPLLLLLALPASARAGDEAPYEAMYAALREGRALALMRHASAPGSGDPANFRLGDCATQRNLSAAGREQARQAGARLRAAGITAARIYSSQWCRCLETARLLDLGEVRALPALNSLFGNPAQARDQTAELAAFLRAPPPGTPLILVSHQANIGVFADAYLASGEILVVALPLEGEPEVLGRIEPPG